MLQKSFGKKYHNSIICHTQLKEKTPTLSDVRGLIKNNVKPKKVAPTEEIVKMVADKTRNFLSGF